MVDTTQGFPNISAAITTVTNGQGNLTQPWYRFFVTLWNRTGGASGNIPGIVSIVSSTGTQGVITTVDNPTTTPNVNIGLGTITPTGIISSGNIFAPNFTGASSGSNTGDVTLAGQNYLTIAGQVLTAGQVNLSGANATGILAAARFPALTGDVTNSAGTVATTVGAILNKTITSLTGTSSVLVLNITPTINQANLVGTITNDNAAAGSVGEYMSAVLGNGAAVSLTSPTPANVVSFSLTAGDWDIWGVTRLTLGGTTVVQSYQSGINTTSATQPSADPTANNSGRYDYGVSGSFVPAASGFLAQNVAPFRVSIASTTTYYLVTTVQFTTSTAAAFGALYARRIR